MALRGARDSGSSSRVVNRCAWGTNPRFAPSSRSGLARRNKDNFPRNAGLYPPMNRQKIIISATILLVVFSIVYWVWSNWGLITVDVNGKPLSEVIRSIEKQGHIVLKTNMDAAKPVSMHVFKVPLTEALE